MSDQVREAAAEPLTAQEVGALRSVGVEPYPQIMRRAETPIPSPPDPDLPGLARIMGAVRSDLSPVALAGFLSTAQPDLEAEGRALSPAEWLRSGRDVGAVARIAREL